MTPMTTRRSVLALMVTCLMTAPLFAESQSPSASGESRSASTGKTVRLLTIGNSFSRNATQYLDELAMAGGHQLIHHPIVVGGASLQLHARKAALAETSPDDPDSRYSDRETLKEKLRSEPWDIVTIQQASILSHDIGTYRPYAAELAAVVRKHAPQARLMLHETWAYRVDDPRFRPTSPRPGDPETAVAMHDQLRAAYLEIARELEAGVIPVGDAFAAVARDEKWRFHEDTSFDPKTATYPQLPDQRHSLHVGWRWRKSRDERQQLGMDGHHANLAGEYLGSCVFYEVLFGADVTKNPFTPPTLDPEFAKFLRETAHRVATGIKAGN